MRIDSQLAACLVAALVLVLSSCSGGGGTGPDDPGSAPSVPIETLLAHSDGAFRDGDFKEAQKTYEQALALAPEDGHIVSRLATCYLKNRFVKKADAILADYISRHPSDQRALLVQARVQIRQGRLEPAAAALRAVLASDPDSLLALYNLGFIAHRSRRYEEAETHLRRAIRLSPRHPEAHYRLGLTYLAQTKTDESIAAFNRAVEIDPEHVGAHFNLANALARAGRMSEAEEHQHRYAALSGRSEAEMEIKTQIVTLSTVALQHEMNERFSEALSEYEKLAAQFPDHAPLHKDIGRLRMKLGRPQEALMALQRAIELDPRLSDAHYLLSALYRHLGDPVAAERELEVFAVLETIPEGKSGY